MATAVSSTFCKMDDKHLLFFGGHCFYFTLVLFSRKPIQIDWNHATGSKQPIFILGGPLGKIYPISSHPTFPDFSKLSNP